MNFKKVDSQVDFPKLERRVLKAWEKRGTLKDYLKKNARAKKKFRFLDGPITANNPMGVHHAWGRSYKDLFQRYKNMRGFHQRFQNGFDCQGLHVEVEVEKDLGFNSKKDIEKFGLANFSKACTKRVKKYSKVQTDQSLRLGYWMDWENSYYTFSDKNIEYIWYFLKKCYEKGWLYKGLRSLPWCTRCGTSLSQHELFDSYQEMTHKSVFLRFPVTGKEREYFLVWTTTPWTLAGNAALAVHPEFTYVRAKVGNEVWILAKDLLGVLDDNYEVLEELPGSKLEGLKYESPFAELPVQKDTQRVVLLWDEVSSEEGTGVVHIAPGCGDEDFELGKEYKLKVLVPLNEDGNYVEGYGFLTGKFAHSVEDSIFDFLRKKDLLYKIEEYTHRYPICWRCKEPIVFRAEENWFILADEIRPKMLREARKVKWHPEYVGKLMEDWLNNMRDWNISRKRYFGLPLPFYECKCGEIVIVGSKKELRRLAVDPKKADRLPELHRPWIDEIKIKCPKCGEEVERIVDVGDCWLDAGIVPFSTLKYFEDQSYWREWFPADWISEMREQVRLWFYSMLFMAVALEDRTPYLEVLGYEKLYDEEGKPMHKSAGNVIWFDEGVEKMGADIMRWMYFAHDPATNINFGYGLAEMIRRRLFLILWNCYKFFVDYASIDGFDPGKEVDLKGKKFTFDSFQHSVLDRWIISKLNRLGEVVEGALDRFDAMTASQAIEEYIVQDFSQWYIRRSRDRVGPTAPEGVDKTAAYVTLYGNLLILSKLLASFTPFIAEEIYQNLVGGQKSYRGRRSTVMGVEDSVHLSRWPDHHDYLIDQQLLEDMSLVREIVEKGHSFRKAKRLVLRQPLPRVEVKGFPGFKSKFHGELTSLIADELNVKEAAFKKGKGELSLKFDTKLTKELKAEGYARKLVREIQDLRKEKELKFDDRIKVTYPETEENKLATQYFEDLIRQKTLAVSLKQGRELLVHRVGRK